MKISATNRDHRARYTVYLDGVDVSDCVQEADDVAHTVTLVIRRPDGSLVRLGTRVLKATVFGHVTIVSRANAPALMESV